MAAERHLQQLHRSATLGEQQPQHLIKRVIFWSYIVIVNALLMALFEVSRCFIWLPAVAAGPSLIFGSLSQKRGGQFAACTCHLNAWEAGFTEVRRDVAIG